MKRLNKYLDRLDCGPLKEFCIGKGELHEYKRHEFYCRAGGAPAVRLGYIMTGGVHYVYTDAGGNAHTVGFGFDDDFVADYSAFLQRRSPVVDIQALENTVICSVSQRQFDEFIGRDRNSALLRQHIGEQLFIAVYDRLLKSYAQSPEERYIDLLARYSDILNRVPMKIIASFIGVAPESLSRIRQRLARK